MEINMLNNFNLLKIISLKIVKKLGLSIPMELLDCYHLLKKIYILMKGNTKLLLSKTSINILKLSNQKLLMMPLMMEMLENTI